MKMTDRDPIPSSAHGGGWIRSSSTVFLDLPSLESFLRTRLAEPLPGADAQWRFSPLPTRKGWRPELQPPEARPAAALLLLYPGANGPVVPLTMRHSELPQHAGQISLPGGRIGSGESPVAAALRETHEEIGVTPGDVRIVGELSSLWVVVSNHLLRTFVGVVERRPDFVLAPREVDALLEVPLGDLRDARRLGWSRHSREGIIVDYPHFELDGLQVWGATAMVLGEFACLFDAAFSPPERVG
jgi:8-oxo-dGTP pyrophosphatase MutT (NUDIX family)